MMGNEAGGLKQAYRALLPASARRTLRLSGRWLGAKEIAAAVLLTITDPTIRRMQERLRALRGRWKGQRCVIMGNGPSLNRTDLELLAGEHVWGTNRCYLLFDRVSWRPGFYTAVDERVLPDIASEIMSMAARLPQTLCFFPRKWRLRRVLDPHPNVLWYRELELRDDATPETAFSVEATRGLYSVRTVTVAAMQLAAYLGFNPIYLIGCDTSYQVPSTVLRDRENPDGLTSTRDDDPNHFDPSYFGRGRRWHEPHVERMVEHYQLSRQVCDHLGITVYDATDGGLLTVFPKVVFEEVFGRR